MVLSRRRHNFHFKEGVIQNRALSEAMNILLVQVFGISLLMVTVSTSLGLNNSTKPTDSAVVLTTWGYFGATETAWDVIDKGGSALDAVEAGCSKCEEDQCRGTVGYGGSPDEDGETTLDAMIMDGPTHDVGAVSGLRRIKEAISVARAVLTYTKHTMLVGDSATKFAVSMGFTETNLSTPTSVAIAKKWRENNCQPNFRQNVSPDPSKSCGPYSPKSSYVNPASDVKTSADNHDTIGMIAIDKAGNIASGTSTNGLTYKVSGRVGDSPIAGAGSYVEQGAGGAAATGNGDIMMRFLPTYYTVSLMSAGKSPEVAASSAISRIVKYYPDFSGAIVAASMDGVVGAACHGYKEFPFTYRRTNESAAQVVTVKCL